MINKLKSSAAYKQFRRATGTIGSFLKKCLHDWSLAFAAMLAYDLLVVLVPIAIALFGVFGLVLKAYPDAGQGVKNTIINAFPADTTTQGGIRQVVALAFDQLSKEAGGILAIGIVFSMIGASRLFTAIDKCMTIIYRVPERPLLRRHILAVEMVFVFVILMALMLVLSTAPSILMSGVDSGFGRFGIFIGAMLFSSLAAFILFEVVYSIIPNRKMPFKVTWCGALVATCALEVFIITFPLYVRRNMDTYTGQIGFALIFIVFLYYFAIILILGAQINAFFFDNYPPLPHGMGTCLSQMNEEYGISDPRRPLYDEKSES